MLQATFATAFLPTAEYLFHLLKYDEVQIEACEFFPDQTNRNRCHILGPNGVQTLSIPLCKHANKTPVCEIEIANGNWKVRHWRSIETAYNRSALFEHYREEFRQLFFADEKNLLRYNTGLLNFILNKIKSTTVISYTSTFRSTLELDFRYMSNGKTHRQITDIKLLPYHQVFADRFAFIPNLSVVDFLFNTGGR